MDKINYNNFNREDFVQTQKERDRIFESISYDIQTLSFKSIDVQNKIYELFNCMNKLYDCSISVFRGLAEVYEFNPSFSKILSENYGKEMPRYLSKAIVYFCDVTHSGEWF